MIWNIFKQYTWFSDSVLLDIICIYILSINVCEWSAILVGLDMHGKKELARNTFNKDDVCGWLSTLSRSKFWMVARIINVSYFFSNVFSK